ncbi:hypothetical protein [uncultured Sutterella sp.]|uniref:hypothetical protein n=1 Tax=uncultured Sutterella sp. TaxID=286133 RepID=UPI0025F7C51B|nr:hypothetical protein [uncultured Sutterella sp.]
MQKNHRLAGSLADAALGGLLLEVCLQGEEEEEGEGEKIRADRHFLPVLQAVQRLWKQA